MTPWTIGEAAEKCGLSQHTLRWPGSTLRPGGSPWRAAGPIPGTKRIKWLEQNVAALDITLTPAELAQLDPLAAQVVGARY